MSYIKKCVLLTGDIEVSFSIVFEFLERDHAYKRPNVFKFITLMQSNQLKVLRNLPYVRH